MVGGSSPVCSHSQIPTAVGALEQDPLPSWGDCPLLSLINHQSLWMKVSAKLQINIIILGPIHPSWHSQFCSRLEAGL